MATVKGGILSKNGKRIDFRPLESGDTEELLKIINQISKGISDYSKLTESQMKKLMKIRLSMMEEDGGIFLVLEHAGRIIGECTLHKLENEPSTGVIGIGLLKEFRNSGIGKGILGRVIKFAKKMNIKKIITKTSSRNKPAIKLYTGIGFKEIKLDKNEIIFVRTVLSIGGKK